VIPSNNTVRIYLCGVTVYDDCHIGHARTIVIFDVLRRFLVSKEVEVTLIQNFTDVDDKIINRAKHDGLPACQISEKYIKNYFEDFQSLNVINATKYPKATDHIKEMIDLIKILVERNFAYITLNGIYFRVKNFARYGALSNKITSELESGSRIQVDELKEDPLDFALWKFSSEEPCWKTPWGKGRPGWHIECSAMALRYLGNGIEIHGGGLDLIFPHHENELAQSEAATSNRFVKLWMHVGLVTINREKMSKSLGNVITIKNALQNSGKNSLRLFLISSHYSNSIDYTVTKIKESVEKWKEIEHCLYELKSVKKEGCSTSDFEKFCSEVFSEFDDAINTDLNTHLAISSILKLVNHLNKLISFEELTTKMAQYVLPLIDKMMFILGLSVDNIPDAEKKYIEDMIKLRSKFRINKNYAESDKIRKQLLKAHNVELIDHENYTSWKKIEMATSETEEGA
jgi:cysteinyl-tRNA synthetase